MSLEIELQNRLLGVTPSYEQLRKYADIFRVSPNHAFEMAYIDGYYKAGCRYIEVIEELTSRLKEINDNQNRDTNITE